jgi:hypothetical protein
MEALTLSGERRGVFSTLFLVRDDFNEQTQTYDTRLENIFETFLHTADLLQTFDATSENPVSAEAIANHLVQELLNYRRLDQLIPMADIDNLLVYLQNYRLLSNSTFVNLTTQTFQYHENNQAVDLATRIQALDARLTADEQHMSQLSVALAGENVMESEQSYQDLIVTHVRDKLIDSVWRSGTFHKNFVAGNEWSSTWTLSNYFVTHK